MAFRPSKRLMRKKAEMEKLSALRKGYDIGRVFEVFGKLPAELRVRIWKEVASTARIIRLRLNRDRGLRGKGWSSSARVPALLHTNVEARQEGLKQYPLFFPFEQGGSIISPPRVYFNPLVDTLYLNMNAYETSIGPWIPDKQSLAKVQHLAIQTDVWTYDADHQNHLGNGRSMTLEALSKYRALKTFTLVRDFTTILEHKRPKCLQPVRLRQRLNKEKKILEQVQKQLEKMAEKDNTRYTAMQEQHILNIARKILPASAPKPPKKYVTTPAIRLLEYKDIGPQCDNGGAKGYDAEGKWIGYVKGKFTRIGKGWEWIIPKQWDDEEGNILEEKRLAMQQVGGWR